MALRGNTLNALVLLTTSGTVTNGKKLSPRVELARVPGLGSPLPHLHEDWVRLQPNAGQPYV